MLFQNEIIDLKLKDGEVLYFPHFLPKEESDLLFSDLLNYITWQEDYITIFGKTYLQPRLTALYAQNVKPYSYSGVTMYPKPFFNTLQQIKNKVEDITNTNFTSCLCNLYRNGQDSNGWHSDDEKELGKNPTIASVSFGAERVFHFKHKHDSHLKQKLILNHGSLLLMKGSTQHFWLHQLPKTKKEIEKRINLTFRTIY